MWNKKDRTCIYCKETEEIEGISEWQWDNLCVKCAFSSSYIDDYIPYDNYDEKNARRMNYE